MTTFARIDAALVGFGWFYDTGRVEFRGGKDGTRRVDYKTLLTAMPGITLEDLAGYVTYKHEQQQTDEHFR
jgi:hypothetical protein